MTPRSPNITLHVVQSLDGFIARKDEDVAWLSSSPDAYPPGVPEDMVEFETILASIDAYVLGSRTYEHALTLGWPYGEKPVLVMTSRALRSPRANVEFHSGDLTTLVREQLAPRFANVWLVGGASLCQSFLALDLVDRIVLSIAPVMLGDGLRLFDGPLAERRWRLIDVSAYRTGFVELSYESEPR